MAPKASVQEASPSPPPLPPGPIPTASSSNAGPSEIQPADVPIASIGEDEDEDDEDEDDEDEEDDKDEDGEGQKAGAGASEEDGSNDEEWDPAEERLPGQSSSKDKGKGKATEHDASQPWQAVWAGEQNAWYFWNAETGQVTWTNPLEPAPPLPTEPAPPAPINPPLPKEAPPLPEGKFGEIPDIDPDLAYLLPATQRVGGDGQNASFNARTGKFQQADGTNYAFDHLDEYNRAKRMAGKYFDVDNWEKNLREENAKRKRDEAMGITQDNKITKKDMERFKKKKAEQKWKKQAWLRD